MRSYKAFAVLTVLAVICTSSNASLWGRKSDDPESCGQHLGLRGRIAGFINPKLSGQLATIQVVAANLDFTARLLQQLGPDSHLKDETILFSPYGISTALVMARLGMTGTSANETDGTLGFVTAGKALPLSEMLLGNHEIASTLASTGHPDTRFSSSNGLWLAKKLALNPEYASGLKKHFSTTIENVDFATSDAVDIINGTVSRQTSKMVPKLLEKTSPLDVLYLTNALALQGTWAVPFDRDNTTAGTFTLPSGANKTVNVMNRVSEEAFVDAPDYEAVRLPLAGNQIVVDLILPKNKNATQYVDGLTLEKLNDMSGALADASKARTKIALELPRLSLSFARNLIPTLQAMGLKAPFAGGSDLAGTVKGVSDLSISVFQHEAALEMTEIGVKLGAGTAVGTDRSMPPHIEFLKPFLILIRSTANGTAIAAGIVNDPGNL